MSAAVRARTGLTQDRKRRAWRSQTVDAFPGIVQIAMTPCGGFTTGPFAAAAAKAALAALCGMPVGDSVDVLLPDGERVSFPVLSSRRNRVAGEAVVRRFAGDNPNASNRGCVAAEVRFIPGDEVVFAAGEGVGVISKPGLALPPGEPASILALGK